MAKTYIYGGYIVTGGNLDNGSPWQGVRVLLAETSAERPTPMTAISAKAVHTPELVNVLARLPLHSKVCVSAELSGRITDITPVKG